MSTASTSLQLTSDRKIMGNRIANNLLALAGLALVITTSTLVQAADGYETPPVLNAADLMSGLPVSGPNYTVEAKVANDGLMNTFIITSPYGKFPAFSNAEMVKRVNEIAAIAKLKELSGSAEFGKGIADAGGQVVEGTKDLVTHPVDTVSGAFKGLGAAIRRTSDSVLGDASSKYEDKGLKGITGVSDAKRQFAAQMGVDPYSSNEVLQEELTSVARASAGGNIVTSAALMAVGGGAGTFISVTGGVESLNDVLEKTPPTDLRRMNRESLEKMGMNADMVDLFMANTNYSPTYQLLLVDALSRMPDVGGRDAMLKIAISAYSDPTCMFRQRQARMLAGYNAKVKPLKQLKGLGDVIVALAGDGTIVITLPVDHVAWTELVAKTVTGAEEALKAAGPGKRELWLGGTISPRAREELEARGWKIFEKSADTLIGAG
jgi:hypothetical protein